MLLRGGKALCLCKQTLRLRGIDLIKRLRTEPHRHAAERIADDGRTGETACLPAENDICPVAVDIEHHGADFRELRGQRGAEPPEGLRQDSVAFCRDKAHHNLAAVIPAAQVEMPQHALTRAFVVGLDRLKLLLREEMLTQPQNLPEHSGLQTAVRQRNEPVRARRVKPEARRAGFRKPAAGILRLIAAAVKLFCAENRADFLRGDVSEPFKCVADDLLFHSAFRFVSDMPEHAAAAFCKVRAVRHGAVGRGRANLLNDTVCEMLLHLDNAHIECVPDCRHRHKDGKTAEVPHAVAFCGHTGNIQRNDLIFLQSLHRL